MTQFNVIERRMSRFLREPVSVRSAASLIVFATALIVVASGALMRVLDHREYENVWVGIWWAMQTVTTVGYGDVTPRAPSGRIVASFVMLEGIALLAIVTAAITSTFVARAQRLRKAEEAAGDAEEERIIAGRFDDLAARLDRVETILGQLSKRWPDGPAPGSPG